MSKTKRNASLPSSHATNAYDLITELITVLLAEPKRLNMGCWIVKDVSTYVMAAPSGPPACGTVGCVAGWIHIMRHPTDVDQFNESYSPRTARFLLLGGLDFKNEDNDVIDEALNAIFYSGDEDHEPGTPEYAAYIVKELTDFQSEYESILRARQLPVAFTADDVQEWLNRKWEDTDARLNP